MKYLILICVCIRLSCMPVFAADASSSASFRSGVQAFESGHYDDAARHFTLARSQGLDTPALHYNLGVSHYRASRNSPARQAFTTLLRWPDWQALAHYNLGLVAEKEQHDDLAMHHYKQASLIPGNPRIRELSQRAMSRLAPPRPDSELTLYLGAGYDSQPSQWDANDLSGHQDFFVDAYGHLIRRNGTSPWRFDGIGYLREYRDNDTLNNSSMQAALLHEYQGRRWRTETGPRLGLSFLDHSYYQSRAEWQAQVVRRISRHEQLSLSVEFAAITAAADYDRTDGWQARAGAGWNGAWQQHWFRLNYRAEWNDRDDQEAVEGLLSLSSLRHRWRLVAGTPLSALWWAESGLEYEDSQYRYDDLVDGIAVRRQDTRYGLLVRAGRPLSANWHSYAEASFNHQRSNIDAADNDRLTLQWVFEYRK